MADNLTFLTIPLDWRVPGAFVEVSTARAVRDALAIMSHKILLLGQRLPSGSAAAGQLKRITRSTDGIDYFGRGSMLAQMVAASLKVNSYTQTYALALDDLPAGNQATGTITAAGTATAADTLYVYVGGVRHAVGIAVGDTATAIAGKIVAAINANLDGATTAANAAGVVTLTARHKGLCGNDIDIRIGYYDGESQNVPGVTFTVVAMSGGTGNPDVLAAIAAMSSGAFYSIAMAWTDTANLVAMEAELRARWGGMDMRTGHVFGFLSGNYTQLATIGSGRNSPHSTLFGLKKCPTLTWVAAAQLTAAIDGSGGKDPAIPFRGLVLPDVMAPTESDRFRDDERNLLLHDGISTIIFDDSGLAMVEQVVTTYQTNTYGMEDPSLLKLNTKWTVDYMRYVFRYAVVRDYPNHKLADDDVLDHIQPGQRIVTPKLARNTMIGEGIKLRRAGQLEDLDQFIRDLVVVRSMVDRNRLNAILPPNIVNQFDVFAAAVEFIL